MYCCRVYMIVCVVVFTGFCTNFSIFSPGVFGEGLRPRAVAIFSVLCLVFSTNGCDGGVSDTLLYPSTAVDGTWVCLHCPQLVSERLDVCVYLTPRSKARVSIEVARDTQAPPKPESVTYGILIFTF